MPLATLPGLRAQLVVTPPVAPASSGRAGSGAAGGLLQLLGSRTVSCLLQGMTLPQAGAAAAAAAASQHSGGLATAGSSGSDAAVGDLQPTLQPGGSSGGAATTSGGSGSSSSSSTAGFTLHVVPLRASRSLVLRYVACRYGLDLEHLTLAAFHLGSSSGSSGTAAATAATATAAAPPSSVTMRCSDGEDLVSGLPRVVLLPAPPLQPSMAATPQQQQPSVAAVGHAPCTFPVDLTPFSPGGRILVLS